jgi:hypothetical protein
MDEFESVRERSGRLYRHLESLIKRVEAGQKPERLRDQLSVELMMSPLQEAEQREVFRRFDHAVAAIGQNADR